LGRSAARKATSALRVDALSVCATTFWEIAQLAAKGRLRLGGSPTSFRASVLELGIKEIPVDGDIAITAAALSEALADPADCHIVAAALRTGAKLMTADTRVQESGVVGTIDAAR
jgi:PIN domain nuclease of toxin-antitoxin system